MAPINYFRLLLDALLRPARFAAFIGQGRRAALQAVLATIVWLGALFLVLVLGVGQVVPLDSTALVVGCMLALVWAMFLSLVYGPPTIAYYQLATIWTFALLRSLIAVMPVAAIFFVIVYSPAYNLAESTSPLLIFLLLVLFGLWIGGALTTALAIWRRRVEGRAIRWVAGIGTLVIAVAMWWASDRSVEEIVLLSSFWVGMSIGVLRLFSYLWEVPLGLGLGLAARLGVPASRLLPFHPARYDELCLLPLPGLGVLLAHTGTHGPDWILRLARHPTQFRAAWRTVEHLVCQGRHAHGLLLQLSIEVEGVALLRAIVDETGRPHPLTAAYAALAQGCSPEEWPAVVAQQRPALAAAAHLPGGRELLALLDAGAGILRADGWPQAIGQLRAVSGHPDHGPGTLGLPLVSLHTWADFRLPALLPDREQAIAAIWDEFGDRKGWPADLIAAAGEHLWFLLTIEWRRSAEPATGWDRSRCRSMMTSDAAARPAHGRAVPIALPEDTLYVHISRQRGDPPTYQFTLHQSGVALMGGPSRPEIMVNPADIQAIRAEYEEQVRSFHEWAAEGMPISPPDEQAMVALGRRVANLLPPLAQRSIVAAFLRARQQRHLLRVLLEVTNDARDLLENPLGVCAAASGPECVA